MIASAAHIFVSVLLPVLVIAGMGALIHRWQQFDLRSLVSINLYLFVPVFLFRAVSTSTMPWSEVGLIGVVVLTPMAVLGIVMTFVLRRFGYDHSAIASMVVGSLFFNAANFGIPVAILAFGEEGGRTQALIVMFMNLTVFLVGYTVLAIGQGRGARGALGFFKLPFLYVVILAIIQRETAIRLPAWLDDCIRIIAQGLVPVALVTLGAQLSAQGRWPCWSRVGPVMIIKLMVLPAVTAVTVWLLGLWPQPGAQLILASAGPTAINTLLLAVEVEGDAETAAESVFWTTLGSALTVAIILAILRGLGA
ncbi:MAG: AEC family transporter [Pirellulaceae bacterium]|nr:AEC family transporter [Planctomycetales bacterium]